MDDKLMYIPYDDYQTKPNLYDFFCSLRLWVKKTATSYETTKQNPVNDLKVFVLTNKKP